MKLNTKQVHPLSDWAPVCRDVETLNTSTVNSLKMIRNLLSNERKTFAGLSTVD